MPEILFAPRSRMRRHFRRWAGRWHTVAADSFNRAPEEGLGTGETGHLWEQFRLTGSGSNWCIRSGQARLLVASVGVTFWANVFTGQSDVRVSARITIGTVAGLGVGLAFRGHTNASTLAFLYSGGTTWNLVRYSGGGSVGLATTAAGPSLAAGSSHQFEVTAVGTGIVGLVDGAQVLTLTSSSLQSQMRHGIVAVDNVDHLFDNFRVVRM
jgi:hypothetical protein